MCQFEGNVEKRKGNVTFKIVVRTVFAFLDTGAKKKRKTLFKHNCKIEAKSHTF